MVSRLKLLIHPVNIVFAAVILTDDIIRCQSQLGIGTDGMTKNGGRRFSGGSSFNSKASYCS